MAHTLSYSLLTYTDWSLYLVTSDEGLCFVGSSPASKAEMTAWATTHFPDSALIEDDEKLMPYQSAFIAYFSGQNESLEIKTQMIGTSFQKKVWNGLKAIPYGETLSYSELATLIGYSPKAARAVGTALAANPLLIVSPCHRVVPKSQKPRAFRGGLAMKDKLLTLEQEAKRADV